MPDVDFSKYRTYQWVATKQYPNETMEAEIKRLIDSQLTARGLTKIDNNADLQVGYRVAVSKAERWEKVFRADSGDLTPKLVTVTRGTLGIDVSDRAMIQPGWTGRATKAIDPTNTAEQRPQNLEKAINALMKRFPMK